MNLGPAEILVILVVALLVFGPKRLPEVGRQVGSAMRELRKMQDTVQSELDGGAAPRRARRRDASNDQTGVGQREPVALPAVDEPDHTTFADPPVPTRCADSDAPDVRLRRARARSADRDHETPSRWLRRERARRRPDDAHRTSDRTAHAAPHLRHRGRRRARVVMFILYNRVLHFLSGPVRGGDQGDRVRRYQDDGCDLIATGPLDPFLVRLKIAGYGGLALAMPDRHLGDLALRHARAEQERARVTRSRSSSSSSCCSRSAASWPGSR